MPIWTHHISADVWTVVHFLSLSLLGFYGLHRIWLFWHWAHRGGKKSGPRMESGWDEYPIVTVQLPIFNERFVAGRLIDAVAAMQWPRDRLEIQVLDDSTDDTVTIVSGRVHHWRAKALRIRHIRRRTRDGFKAGALSNGLRAAAGEFVAIFDADFIPPKDYLAKTMPYFKSPDVGMVQNRWVFINADYSWLTRLQAILLGPHFDIEHGVRSRLGLFFNFNGTAGVWRRKAVESAGGWQWDTVTEDLDLSYRAQLVGWRFVYAGEVSVPSELPATLAAFRSQQQRWAKGSIQTARKMLPRLLSSDSHAKVKIEGLFHLLANLGWLFGAIVTLTLYPAIISRIHIGPWQIIWIDIPLFLISGGAILAYYFCYALTRPNFGRIAALFMMPALSIGLAPSLALAVITGMTTWSGKFERTPKFGLADIGRIPARGYLYGQRILPYPLLNAVFAAYTSLPVIFALQCGTWPALPFLLLFPVGFLIVLLLDCREMIPNRKGVKTEALSP